MSERSNDGISVNMSSCVSFAKRRVLRLKEIGETGTGSREICGSAAGPFGFRFAVVKTKPRNNA